MLTRERAGLDISYHCLVCGQVCHKPSPANHWYLCLEHERESRSGFQGNLTRIPALRESNCTAEFTGRRYNVAGISDDRLLEFFNKHRDRSDTTSSQDRDQYLLNQAMLYVLAARYGISDLKAICLFKLHHNLTLFEINEESIKEVTTLVTYVYAATIEKGDILKGTVGRLRDLVMGLCR